MRTGDSVDILFSEPWDLVTFPGDRAIHGSIRRISTDLSTALIDLNEPERYNDREITSLFASARHKGKRFDNTSSNLACGFLASEESLIANFDYLQIQELTGWFQAIGTVTQRHS